MLPVNRTDKDEKFGLVSLLNANRLDGQDIPLQDVAIIA